MCSFSVISATFPLKTYDFSTREIPETKMPCEVCNQTNWEVYYNPNTGRAYFMVCRTCSNVVDLV